MILREIGTILGKRNHNPLLLNVQDGCKDKCPIWVVNALVLPRGAERRARRNEAIHFALGNAITAARQHAVEELLEGRIVKNDILAHFDVVTNGACASDASQEHS